MTRRGGDILGQKETAGCRVVGDHPDLVQIGLCGQMDLQAGMRVVMHFLLAYLHICKKLLRLVCVGSDCFINVNNVSKQYS